LQYCKFVKFVYGSNQFSIMKNTHFQDNFVQQPYCCNIASVKLFYRTIAQLFCICMDFKLQNSQNENIFGFNIMNVNFKYKILTHHNFLCM